MLIYFLNDVDIQRILEFKNSLENIIQYVFKIFKGFYFLGQSVHIFNIHFEYYCTIKNLEITYIGLRYYNLSPNL